MSRRLSTRLLSALLALTAAGLVGCAPVIKTPPASYTPVNTEFGPHHYGLEWWYLSSYMPEQKLAFHWAQFQGRRDGLPVPLYFSHIMMVNLATGEFKFLEKNFGLGTAQASPLKLRQGDWSLTQQGNAYLLDAGPLQLRATPAKPAVIHPPGYSGSDAVGKMFYQSYTRLNLQGTVQGQPVSGTGWFDHQWGNQLPGMTARWDWFSIQLGSGDDVMVYHLIDPQGQTAQMIATVTDPRGQIRPVGNVTLAGRDPWTSPETGYSYFQTWHVQGDGLSLDIASQSQNQELRSHSSGLAYSEGPILVKGTLNDQAVQGKGMMELVAGQLKDAPKQPTSSRPAQH